MKVMIEKMELLVPNMAINQGFFERHFFPNVRSIEDLPITPQLRGPMEQGRALKLYNDIKGRLILPRIVFVPGILAKIWVAVTRCPGELFVWCLVRTEVVPVEVVPGIFSEQLDILVYDVYCPNQVSSQTFFRVDCEDAEKLRQAVKRDHGPQAQFDRLLHLHLHMRGTLASKYDFEEYAALRGGGDFLISCIVDKFGRLEATFWAWNAKIFGHEVVIFDCPWTSSSAPHEISELDVEVGHEFASRVVFDPSLDLSHKDAENTKLPSVEREIVFF